MVPTGILQRFASLLFIDYYMLFNNYLYMMHIDGEGAYAHSPKV